MGRSSIPWFCSTKHSLKTVGDLDSILIPGDSFSFSLNNRNVSFAVLIWVTVRQHPASQTYVSRACLQQGRTGQRDLQKHFLGFKKEQRKRLSFFWRRGGGGVGGWRGALSTAECKDSTWIFYRHLPSWKPGLEGKAEFDSASAGRRKLHLWQHYWINKLTTNEHLFILDFYVRSRMLFSYTFLACVDLVTLALTVPKCLNFSLIKRIW